MKNKYFKFSESRFYHISKFIDRNKFILIEFGFGSGKTLFDIKRIYPASELFGFDFIFQTKSKKLFLFKEDFNNFNYKKYLRLFNKTDYFLFLDVLEHLLEPFDFLNSLNLHARKESKFIITCPNFSSLRMFIAWVGGRLPRNPYGFFDVTHLHWYVPLDFLEFFEKAKFSHCEYEYIFSNNTFFKLIQKIYPPRLCSQFIIIASK